MTGFVTTLAGSKIFYLDAIGTLAIFYNPTGIARDSTGTLYVSDAYNNMLRKISSFGTKFSDMFIYASSVP